MSPFQAQELSVLIVSLACTILATLLLYQHRLVPPEHEERQDFSGQSQADLASVTFIIPHKQSCKDRSENIGVI